MSFGVTRFRRLNKGDVITAAEWNALVSMIEGMYRGSMTDGIIDSTGFHPRRRLTPPAIPIQVAYTLQSTIENETNIIKCSLGEVGGSNEIDVECSVYGGIYDTLKYAFPRLGANQPIYVTRIDDKWICLSPTFHSVIRY